MEEISIKEFIEKIGPLETYHYAILGVVILIFLIVFVMLINKSFKKSSAKKIAPKFTIEQLLVAPLGMGVQVKLRNLGHPVTIIKTEILDRPNVHITQAYENYKLEMGKTFLIFCEATDRRRADSGFKMNIFYTDRLNHKLKQEFFIEATQSKLLKVKFS